MSDATTQKEHLTAWQRWELPAFDAEIAAATDKALAPVITLPTAGQLEQIQRQAHDEGLQAGHAEGFKAGHEEGYQAGLQQANEEAQRLAEMMGALDKELQQVDQEVAQSLLKLSLEVARQMLQQALKVRPELLLEVVQEAIRALPHFNQHAHLILHPADAELVRERLGEHLTHTGWKVFEDALLERGGCRVETANSQIDATLATRWQRVVAAIGRDDKWLEP
ncbi:MAG: flagellar assembly protein FliH [Nitrosomonadales bacterium]|nr:flagellar assembly protein FliH [Nitrosomonadales bacterium]